MKEKKSYVIIYYTADKTKSMQIVRPLMHGENRFEGNWASLVDAITGGSHHSFEIH